MTVASSSKRTSLPPRVRLPRPVVAYMWWRWTVPFLDWCRDRYGDRFTVSVPPYGTCVLLTDPDDIKTLYTTDTETAHAGEQYAKLFKEVMGERALFVLDEDDHLETRKMMLPAFHGESVRRYEALIRELTLQEVESWPIGETIRLHSATQRIALEIILRAIFGVEDPERLATLRSEIPRVVEPRTLAVLSWTMPALNKWGPWKRHWRLIDGVKELLIDEIRRRRLDPGLAERTDVLSQLILARSDSGRSFTDEDLRDELMMLLLAGHETTATSTAWLFERVMRHPHVVERLRAEFVEGSDEYLEAVAKETLRVRPAVFGGGRKLTRDLEIGDHLLPAGIFVGPAICGVQRSPALYDDPLEFRPERFLGPNPPPYSFIPFGGGVRRCLGASFAMLELKTIAKTVLEHVELVPPRMESEAQPCKHATQVPARGAEAIVTRRLQPAESGDRSTTPA